MPITAHRGEILHFLDDPGQSGDETWQYFEDGILIMENGFIHGCGSVEELINSVPGDAEFINHRNGLIIPGMIDTHIHYPQVEVIASYGTQLIDWLQKYTFPVEARFGNKDDATAVAEFFLQELLRNGTTTALVFGTVHSESVDAFFEVARSRNLRMICGKVMMDRNAPENVLDTPGSGYHDSRNLIRKWHGVERLGYAVTPRFAPTSSPQQLELAGRLLEEFPEVHMHTHVSENTRECQWVKELFPEREDYVDVYDHYGLLGRRSVLAHGIHLSEREWQQLSDRGSSIAFCPTSNLSIGSGLFNLNCADRHSVYVGLGTDIGGGDSFSLLRTINEAYKVQQLKEMNLSPFRSMYMATLGGARVLDLEDKIGNFETGKEGDFLVLDYSATPLVEYKVSRCQSLEEKLFAMQMLGDDRTIRETWIMGKRKHARDQVCLE